MKEIRLVLKKSDFLKFKILKEWYNEQKETQVLRNLITEKCQEIKKINLLSIKNQKKEEVNQNV